MATGDKKRAVMTTDINDANGSYGVIGMNKKGAANGVAELDSTGKVPASQLPSGAGPSPSSETPLMNGVADAGSSTDYSRGDHVHPSDTNKLGTSGDGSNVTAAFTAASSRTNISTGEKLTVIFGKVAKWFSDLGAAAFRGVDATPTAGSKNLVESGGVKSALTSLENDLASIHATGNTNTTGAKITAGTYFYLNGVLVHAKTDIAVNASYTSGTNYETVPAGALNSPWEYDTLADIVYDTSNNITVPDMSKYKFLIFCLRGTRDQTGWAVPVSMPYSLFKLYNGPIGNNVKRVIIANGSIEVAFYYVSDTTIRIYAISENRSLSVYGVKT